MKPTAIGVPEADALPDGTAELPPDAAELDAVEVPDGDELPELLELELLHAASNAVHAATATKAPRRPRLDLIINTPL
jgi:hypothetical protein